MYATHSPYTHMLYGPMTAKHGRLDTSSAYSGSPVISGGYLNSQQPHDVSCFGPSAAKQLKLRDANNGLQCQRIDANLENIRKKASCSWGAGLLPSAPHCQPGIFQAPLPYLPVNGPLPAGGKGFLGSDGKSSYNESTSLKNQLSASKTEVISNDHVKQTANVCEKPVVVLPEQEVDRITSELDAVKKKFYMLMNDTKLDSKHRNRQKTIEELKKERGRLQNELKREKERQRLENLQLSKQLEQQYKVSLGSSTTDVEKKQSQVSAKRKRSDGSVQGDESEQARVEEVLVSFLHEFQRITCQITHLDRRIDELEEKSENGQLAEQEQQKVNVLKSEKASLEKKLDSALHSRNKLLKEAAEQRFGVDPFVVLNKLAKNMKMWREARHTELNTAQDEPHETDSCLPLGSKPKESDVIMISDDDGDMEIVRVTDNKSSKLPLHQGQTAPRESRHHHKQRAVRHIGRSVTESGLTAQADQSYFLLSGLASVLFARQHRKKLSVPCTDTGTQPTPPTPQPGHACAVSHLIGQLNSKLNLSAQQEARVQKALEQKQGHPTQKRARINMYVKVHGEQR